MRCPTCEAEGRASTVQERGSVQWCMSWSAFHDTAGVRHSHDPNRRTTDCACSNGHTFQVYSWPTCGAPGCDYGGEERVSAS